jgi:short-subunit dehydrogenase
VLVARREERLAGIADDIEDDHGVFAHVAPADLPTRANRDAL